MTEPLGTPIEAQTSKLTTYGLKLKAYNLRCSGKQQFVPHAFSRLGHPQSDPIPPGKIVRSFFVCRNSLFRFISLVEYKLPRIGHILENVEPQIAGLFNRQFVICVVSHQ